uniref:Uncharacterized protein n=1 Tax=Aedes aegypti TaxID=7159 RepID=A0A903VTS6_AEDAE
MKNLLVFTIIFVLSGVVFSGDLSSNSDSKVLHQENSRELRHIGANGYVYGYMSPYVGYYPPHPYHVQPLGIVPVPIPIYGGGKHHKSKKHSYGLVPHYPLYY